MKPDNQKSFKRPPKKYQPKGLSILYEDRDILVVDKKSGLLTVSNETVRENTAYYLLNEYVRKGNPKSRNRLFSVRNSTDKISLSFCISDFPNPVILVINVFLPQLGI